MTHAISDKSDKNKSEDFLWSGYYKDFNQLAADAGDFDGQRQPDAMWVTLNELDPAIYARCAERLNIAAKETTTSDDEVVRRRWILLDCDPVRRSGISSTDAEHDAGTDRATQIRDWLATDYRIGSVLADSGNGGHVLVPCDLPNDSPSGDLVKQVLEAIAFRFGDKTVEIDATTGNAARVTKLYGTMARKGSSTQDRPHRRSAILDKGSLPLTPVPVADLQAIAGLLPGVTSRSRVASSGIDVEDWLKRHNVRVASEGAWQQGGYKMDPSGVPVGRHSHQWFRVCRSTCRRRHRGRVPPQFV